MTIAISTEVKRQRRFIIQPRVARNELPWVGAVSAANPERVASMVLEKLGFNPFRVGRDLKTVPRVARSSQPWAERFNAFGVDRFVAFIEVHTKP